MVTIRQRASGDDNAIRSVTECAFGGHAEAALIDELHATEVVAIELVAIVDDELVGHILFSRLDVTASGRQVRALALAPMSVRPDHQNRGLGGDLVRRGLEQARKSGWQAVFVLGHTGFYQRFGFSPATAARLSAPFEGPTFMAIELQPDTLTNGGIVSYPAAFGLT